MSSDKKTSDDTVETTTTTITDANEHLNIKVVSAVFFWNHRVTFFIGRK